MSRSRWHPAWTIVAITAAILLLSSGVRSAPGVLILPFEHEFGWSRSSISLAISLGLVLFGLTGPIAGALIDRHGPRRIMLGGVALIAVSSGLGALIAVPIASSISGKAKTTSMTRMTMRSVQPRR